MNQRANYFPVIISIISTLFILFISSSCSNPYSFKLNISQFDKSTSNHSNQLNEFVQPSYIDELLNLSNFNFSGKCREPFKYNQNSERDLVFTSIHYRDKAKWEKDKKKIIVAGKIMKNTIPHAKRVCVIYERNRDVEEVLKESGFEVRMANHFHVNPRRVNAAIDRFIQLHYYLNENVGKIDRVALIDSGDVFFFADGFQTVSYEEVMFTLECSSKSSFKMNCVTYPHFQNDVWLKSIYGKDVVEKYKRERYIIVNVGTIIGGIRPFCELLQVFLDEIERKRYFQRRWGIDNAMLNYLYREKKFEGINITVNDHTQRMAFVTRGGYSYHRKWKTITDDYDGCPPIIRHKLLGNSDFRIPYRTK